MAVPVAGGPVEVCSTKTMPAGPDVLLVAGRRRCPCLISLSWSITFTLQKDGGDQRAGVLVINVCVVEMPV